MFKSLSFVIIIANTIILGLTKNHESEEYSRITEILNTIFFGFFVFELIIKLIGEGVKLYLSDKFNWFDSSVVIISAIDIILA